MNKRFGKIHKGYEVPGAHLEESDRQSEQESSEAGWKKREVNVLVGAAVLL
jgi:hypothetical protein